MMSHILFHLSSNGLELLGWINAKLCETDEITHIAKIESGNNILNVHKTGQLLHGIIRINFQCQS